MLFSYKPITHAFGNMQKFIEFIFHDVWCQAINQDYSIDLFKRCPGLYDIMYDIYRQDQAGKLKPESAANFFYENVNLIYNCFKELTSSEINSYVLIFKANNNIEKCCDGDIAVVPSIYSALNATKPELNDLLEIFFKQLYSSGFLSLAATKERIGGLNSYYHEFVKENNEDVCPFCGLLPLDGEFDSSRDALDHYLPKSKYPFNSVNPNNLAPSCNKCNMTNKKSKDPLHCHPMALEKLKYCR